MRDLVEPDLLLGVRRLGFRDLRVELVEGSLFGEVRLALIEPVDRSVDALEVEKAFQFFARRALLRP